MAGRGVPMKRLRKWTYRLFASLVVLFLIAGAAFLILLRTAWIREQIRSRIIFETEKATGGKVKLQQFDFDPWAMKASVKGFELHGKEGESEPPLALVDAIDVGVTVVSFTRRNLYLGTLIVNQP